MNIASIDIGSNTVLLLIALVKDRKLLPILNKYMSPRLGQGLGNGGKIKDDQIDSLLKILSDYKKVAETYDCKRIIITATNAMRIASNSKNIIKLIKNELDLDVNIISGENEAELSYLGASSSMPSINNKIVIDIGGGSTEIIFGDNRDIFYKKSFQIGVVSLTEKFFVNFPYNNKSIFDATEFLKTVFSELETNIPKNTPSIAVAGTPTTLSCIKQSLRKYDEKKVENSTLTNNDLYRLSKTLENLSPKQIKDNFGDVVNGREDVIFAGVLILKYLLDIINSDIIYVSSRGLRYGNIINYLNNLK